MQPRKPYRVRSQTIGRAKTIGRAETVARAEMVDRDELFARLTHLRTVVPVFAHELASARRQVVALRVANGWLLEQVRQLQRGSARSSRAPLRSRSSDGAAASDPRAGVRIRDEAKPMSIVELTEDQAASIESLSEECTVVGVQAGCPLVRLSGGDVALLGSDGRLVPAANDAMPVLTQYIDVVRA